MRETIGRTYYYMVGEQRHGPFSLRELLGPAIHRRMPVWSKKVVDWGTAGDVPELTDLIPPPPPATRAVDRRTDAAVTLPDYARALRVVNVGTAAFLAVAFAAVWTRAGLIYYAAHHVRFQLPWLWAVGGVVPLGWLAVLVVLHQKLSRPLLQAGYRVSFLGRTTLSRTEVTP